MGRIRTIKPEITQSESLGRVSREARLCFILLWTQADDDGRLRANSRLLASLLYPYDEDATGKIEGWLCELEAEGCVRRYEADGDHFLDIPKWLSHQKIDHKKDSKLPAFDGPSSVSRANSRRGATKRARPRTKDQGRDQGSGTTLSGADAPPAEGLFESFWKAYPKREGSNPKKPAKQKFGRIITRGEATAEDLVEGAKRYARTLGDKVGTQYVAQAVTWLEQARWADTPTGEPEKPFAVPDCWQNEFSRAVARAPNDAWARSWLYPCVPSLEDQTLVLEAPTRFVRDQLLTTQNHIVSKLWADVRIADDIRERAAA